MFRSKRADRIKVLTWDGGGLVLAYKRLEEGSFAWPPIRDGVMKLSAAQFGALFEGLELVSKYADHLPLYRQVQIFARSGVLLDSSTLAGWSGAAGYHLAPLTRRLAEIIQVSGHLFMD